MSREIPQFVQDFEEALHDYMSNLDGSIDEAGEATVISAALEDFQKELGYYRRVAFRHMHKHLGWTYAEIGEEFGITRQRVDQIIHTYA